MTLKQVISLLEQLKPLPKYPGLQRHKYDPRRLMHFDFLWHWWVSRAHSSTSKEKKMVLILTDYSENFGIIG